MLWENKKYELKYPQVKGKIRPYGCRHILVASQVLSSWLKGRWPTPWQTSAFCSAASAGAQEGSFSFKLTTSQSLFFFSRKFWKKGICWPSDFTEELPTPPRNGAFLSAAPVCLASDSTGYGKRRLKKPASSRLKRGGGGGWTHLHGKINPRVWAGRTVAMGKDCGGFPPRRRNRNQGEEKMKGNLNRLQ